MNHVFSSIVCVVTKESQSSSFVRDNIKLANTWNSNLVIVCCSANNRRLTHNLENELNAFVELNSIQQISSNQSAPKILEILNSSKADLLILQEEDKSELNRYYDHSLMRTLIRIVNCSVMIKKSGHALNNYNNLVLNGFDHPKLGSTVVKAQKIGRSLSVKSMLVMNQRNDSKSPMDYNNSMPSSKNNYRVELEEVENNGFQISKLVRARKANLLIMNSPDTKLGFEGRFFSDELDFLISDLPSDILLVHSTKGNS